jgi:hypothetical protein
MLMEKVRERGIKDPLLFHKIGLVVGSLAGFLFGMVISDRADEFDMSRVQEETTDGQKENSVGQSAEQ